MTVEQIDDMVGHPSYPVDRRAQAVGVLCVCAVVLALSYAFTPTPDGSGIVGFPIHACIFRFVTHLPCPVCGMTTAFVLMSHRRPAAALRSHVLGPAAYCLTWLGLLAGAWGAVTGRGVLPARLRHNATAFAVAAVLLIGWTVNLYIFAHK